MTITTNRIAAIPAADLEGIRGRDVDVAGNPVVHLPADGGEPLRCCLRDARPGEDCILFGYEPALPTGTPYRELGAVFAHAGPCDGAPTGYPVDWRHKPQVLRAYDRRGWIHPASRQHDGSDPEAALREVLTDPDVVLVHSRNIAYGCYMFAVTRDHDA